MSDTRKTIALPQDIVDWVELEAKKNDLTFSAQLRILLRSCMARAK